MLHRLNRAETESYLENRRTKGFKVIQTVIICEFIKTVKTISYQEEKERIEEQQMLDVGPF
jgi:hypothetical protein